MIAEAEAVVHRLRTMEAANPELSWGDMAVLYRTNAQSRAIEESLVRWGIPYIVVGGLRFYDRRDQGSSGLSAASDQSGGHRQPAAGDQCAQARHWQDHDPTAHRCGQSTGYSAVGCGE